MTCNNPKPFAMNTLPEVFDTICHPRILVLGDLILDRYTFGNAERVSPEAPVLVLRSDASELRLGGAASVGFLLRNLGANVTLAGVAGDDSAGRMLSKLVDDAGIDSRLVLTDPQRPTTTKERFIGRTPDRSTAGGQQMLRVDSESRDPIPADLETQFVNGILECLSAEPSSKNRFDALLISDYAKGMCTPRLLAVLIAAADKSAVATIVDPARNVDFDRYRQATLVKPNRIEAELASARSIDSPQDALLVGQSLCRQYELGALLITLDREGMALVQTDGSHELFPTQPREVYDITGAGDMVLATLGWCMASGVPLPESVQLANIAAGLEVEKFGVAPVTRVELRRAVAEAAPCRSPSSNPKSEIPIPKSVTKLTTLAALIPIRAAYRESGKSVVFTNGCFDLLHVGHVTMLEQAAALGDVLIVAINSDASVRAFKGPDRPVIPEHDRAQMLASLACVDHVLILDDRTPHRLLSALCPDVLAKGGTTTEIVGHEVVESYGGHVMRLAAIPGISTTTLLASFPPLGRGGRGGLHCLPAGSTSAHDAPVEAASCRLPPKSSAILPAGEIPIPTIASIVNPKSEIPIPK